MPSVERSVYAGNLGAYLEEACIKIESLYEAIAHGDEEHRRWLRAKIASHFGMKESP